MSDNALQADSDASTSPMGCLKIFIIVLLSTTIATVIAVWAITVYFFPKELTPVSLNAKEEQRLSEKLALLEKFDPHTVSIGSIKNSSSKSSSSAEEEIGSPERYSEKDAKRELELSEKELNSLLAKNTDLARKLAIDLSDNLASAKLLIPLDDDFPVLGGKTLKVAAGLELSYTDGKPIIILRGVSIWGVPVPNAWLGNLKNVDIVREFGAEQGFWKSFADGVDFIEVKEGRLRIRLKE